MKKLSLLTLVASALTLNAQAATNLDCKGIDGTKGSLTMRLTKRGITVTGYYIVEGDIAKPVTCKSSTKKDAKHKGETFRYFETTKKGSCPADAVKLWPSFVEDQEGKIALVDKGGDTHDWSGYEYQYFNCTDED
jgi:hypothetical protein